jgi:hypothetical protein
MRALRLLTAAIVVLTSATCYATTVVVKIDGKSIFIAADNRQGLSTNGDSPQFSDNACKILLLGHSVVAAMGEVTHSHDDAEGSKLLVDALADARAAAAAASVGSDDTTALAVQWGKLSVKHVADFYNSHLDSAMKLRGVARTGLNAAIFVGWNNHVPIVRTDFVFLDNGNFEAADTSFPMLVDDNSLNATTQELIAGTTDRAKQSMQRWRVVAQKYPASERVWRHLMFLISETAKIDNTVSQSSDVLQVSDSGKIIWLHRSICK